MTAPAGIGIAAIGAGAETERIHGLPAYFVARQRFGACYAPVNQENTVFAYHATGRAVHSPRILIPACFDFVIFV